MRTFSFMLAFAFIVAGPTLAGSSDNGLPGIGTFAYNGSPVVTMRRRPWLSQPAKSRLNEEFQAGTFQAF